MKRSKLKPVALHVVLPLTIGVVAYAAWRSEDVRIVAWLARVVPGAVHTARTGGAAVDVPHAVAGSLPDLAWAWAFGAMLAIVWRGRAWREKAPWIAGGGVVALFCEVGQAWGIVPGTFDPLDLLAITVGYAGGVAISARERARRPTPAPPGPDPGSSHDRAAPP
jgi:hypothetical protein